MTTIIQQNENDSFFALPKDQELNERILITKPRFIYKRSMEMILSLNIDIYEFKCCHKIKRSIDT